jgi:hypothetical protein
MRATRIDWGADQALSYERNQMDRRDEAIRLLKEVRAIVQMGFGSRQPLNDVGFSNWPGQKARDDNRWEEIVKLWYAANDFNTGKDATKKDYIDELRNLVQRKWDIKDSEIA